MGSGQSTETTVGQPTPNNQAAEPVGTSCYKKKSFDDDSYWDGFKEFSSGFFHASMDDHKKCFKSKYQKVFKRSKAVSDQENSEGKGANSTLPLGTTSTTLVKG